MSDWIVLLVAAVPLFVLWGWALWDLARSRHDLDRSRRAGWAIVLVVLPVIGLAAYLVARPPLERRLGQVDDGGAETAASVVEVAERHQRGELTDDEYRTDIAALTHPSS